MITLDRLSQIIPPDQALANKALAVSLQQITGISRINLPDLAVATKTINTNQDLPILNSLTQPVPASVADYFIDTLAIGGGANGDIQITDIIGLAGGWVATDAFDRTVAIFATMNLSYLTLIYQTMTNALNGTYGDTTAGPLVIPGGLPGAGTYVGTETDPGPPPEYDPTAIQEAMAVLNSAALTEIINLQNTYPTQTAELNSLWTSMAEQVVNERALQLKIKLDYTELSANDPTPIYGFVFSLPGYGLQTEVGGMFQFIESMVDLSTLTGQSIIGVLRQGKNQQVLNSAGIYTNSNIPADPNPPPPQAELLPSEYSETEAASLVIK